MIDHLTDELEPLDRELRAHARRQAGCRALQAHYGIGELTAVTILAELGDARRFGSSRRAVRYAGMDITVVESDRRRAPGHLSRQGPPALRWALYEAAQVARRHRGSPNRDYYEQTAERIGGNRASPRGCPQAAPAQLPHAAHPRGGGAGPGLKPTMRATARHQLIACGRLPAVSCRRAISPDGLERPSGRTASQSGSPHQPSCRRPPGGGRGPR